MASPKSSDLKYSQQRVYTKTGRGMELAETKLKTTAYTLLSEADKKTILDAIKQQLKENMKDQEIMPPRALLDYNQLVDGVIKKVFGDNLDLFKFGSKSTPTVDELLDYKD
ncbi:hypothetical protein PG996_005174 [Apiospora saccharicola]|uniref:Uncharacterized protein n=1 Tax=Apiospora saccharicola TaxID=335842 RepID=A0ABR1VNG2_9PEZI